MTKHARRGETLVSRTRQSKRRNNWAVRKQPRGTLMNHRSVTNGDCCKLSLRSSILVVTRCTAVWTCIEIQIRACECSTARNTHVMFHGHDTRYFLEGSFGLIKGQEFVAGIGCHIDPSYGFIMIARSICRVNEVP